MYAAFSALITITVSTEIQFKIKEVAHTLCEEPFTKARRVGKDGREWKVRPKRRNGRLRRNIDANEKKVQYSYSKKKQTDCDAPILRLATVMIIGNDDERIYADPQ